MRGKIPNVAYFLGRKYNGKRKDFISPFLVVLIPLSFVLLIFFSSYEPNSNYNELVFYSSLLIGNGIGLLYHLFVIFTAQFKRLFNIVSNRIKDLFGNFRYGIRFTFMCYKDDLLENCGIIFWYYLIVMIINLILFITGLVNSISYF